MLAGVAQTIPATYPMPEQNGALLLQQRLVAEGGAEGARQLLHRPCKRARPHALHPNTHPHSFTPARRCLTQWAASYTYEVCFFANASQRVMHAPRDTGRTSLGIWQGFGDGYRCDPTFLRRSGFLFSSCSLPVTAYSTSACTAMRFAAAAVACRVDSGAPPAQGAALQALLH
eukprot:364937-Chlamydomonas_euryale.AAC.23